MHSSAGNPVSFCINATASSDFSNFSKTSFASVKSFYRFFEFITHSFSPLKVPHRRVKQV